MTTISSLTVLIGANISGLQQGLQNAVRGVQDFDGRLQQVEVTGRRFLHNTDGSLIGVGQSISGLNKKMHDLGLGFLPAAGGAALVGIALKGSIGAAIEFESSFANVRKTVDASEEELAQLRDTLRDMATSDSPVGALDNALITLTDIASAAGQLGVATEDIAEFSETMAMLDVATDMTATDAAVFAARFANVTGMDFSLIDELGDSIVTLGNNMATTESEIARFGSRLSPLSNYNWNPAEILGYSAALSALGVSAELGGTNLNKSVAEMTTAVAIGGPKLQTYADIAGTTAENFKELASEDSQAAFRQFVTGLANLDADQQILQLNKLGITSVEQITTLQRLAGGLGTLNQALDLANEGWEGNGAVMTEAAAKADTTEGKINRLENALKDFGIAAGEVIQPVLNVAVEVTATALEAGADILVEATKLGQNLGTHIGNAIDIIVDWDPITSNLPPDRVADSLGKQLENFFVDKVMVVGSPLRISLQNIEAMLAAADTLDPIRNLIMTEVAGIKPIEAAVSTALSLIAPGTPEILAEFNTVLDEVSRVGPTGERPFVHKLYMSTPIEIIPGVLEVTPSGRPWLDKILHNMEETSQRVELAIEFALNTTFSMTNPETGRQFGMPLPPMLTDPITADVDANIILSPTITNGEDVVTSVGSQAATIVRDASPFEASSTMSLDALVSNGTEIVSGVQSYLQGQNYDTTVAARLTVITEIERFYEENPEFGGYTPGQQKPVPGYDGSHAAGIGYVPYDNYLAQLHQGERVMTAEENQRYSAGGGRGTVVVNLTNFGGNMQEAAEMIKRALRDAGT